MIVSRNLIEQSVLMRYYTFWRNTVWSASLERIEQFKECIQIGYAKIDQYTPHGWMSYNERNDSSYTDG